MTCGPGPGGPTRCPSPGATPGLVSAQAQTGSMPSAAATSPLGDLSEYRTMAEDALKLAKAGDIAGARKRLK